MASGFHICSFTTFADLVIEADGECWRFEFSKLFGPIMLGKRGQPLSALPPQRSMFWKVLHQWCIQGYRGEDGRCLYNRPPITRYVHMAGRHWIQVPNGHDPQEFRVEWFASHNLDVPPGFGEVQEQVEWFTSEVPHES